MEVEPRRTGARVNALLNIPVLAGMCAVPDSGPLTTPVLWPHTGAECSIECSPKWLRLAPMAEPSRDDGIGLFLTRREHAELS